MYTADTLSQEASRLLFELQELKQVVGVWPDLMYALNGNGNATILLRQFIFCASKRNSQSNDGWFYLTHTDILLQTGLAVGSQQSQRRFLKKLGLIEEKRAGADGRMHFRVNLENVTKLYASKRLRPQSVHGGAPKPVHAHAHEPVHGGAPKPVHAHAHEPLKEAKTLHETKTKSIQISHTSAAEAQAKSVCVSKSRFSLAECEEFAHSLNQSSGYEVREKPIRNPGGFAYKIFTTASHDENVAAYLARKARGLQHKIDQQVELAIWWLTNGPVEDRVTTWPRLREVLSVELWPLLEEPIRSTLASEHSEILARLDGQREPTGAVA